MRVVLALLLFLVGAFGAVSKLYLKDGNYQLVREWRREGDRVKYYSTERSDWEEIPVDLVDLRRTEAEIAEQKDAVSDQAKTVAEEEQALRSQSRDIQKIPQDAGVYQLADNGQLSVFKLAESKVHTNKGRNLLKSVAPVPIITGKATVELDQEHSSHLIAEARPEFYLQLAKEERFGMIRLTPHHGVRVAERLTIVPVANETVEEIDEIATFKKQLTESGLYKVWPEKALDPGEYALIEYTPGKVEPQIWDFQVTR